MVREASLKKKVVQSKSDIMIQGISGNTMKVKGVVQLTLNNCKDPVTSSCYVVEKLPRDIDVILGQDWLLENDYVISKSVIIPPYSETVVRFPTQEKGIRFIEQQSLQPGLMCASSLTQCDKTFACLLVNVTSETINCTKMPELKKPPTQMYKNKITENYLFTSQRVKTLHENLRLDHINKGTQEAKQICTDLVDIFKLPG